MTKLTEKQKKFCEEYLIDLNGTQAAIRAGYNPKTANNNASRLMVNDGIKEYLSELMNRKRKKRIATSDDVLAFLTDVLYGEDDTRDRLKAAELLAKYHGLMAPQQLEVKTEVSVNIEQFNALLVNVKHMTVEDKTEYKRKLKEIMED